MKESFIQVIEFIMNKLDPMVLCYFVIGIVMGIMLGCAYF